MFVEDKILEIVRVKGPVLPVNISKEIGTDILMASAHLSQLSSSKKLKISNLKVGGSPLYYLPGQEFRLQNFSNNLPGKEKEAMEMLRSGKVLRDSSLEPAARVALRQIKDFAVPLNVRHNGGAEIFWKWFLLSQEETNAMISSLLQPKHAAIQKPEEINPQDTAVKKQEAAVKQEPALKQKEPEPKPAHKKAEQQKKLEEQKPGEEKQRRAPRQKKEAAAELPKQDELALKKEPKEGFAQEAMSYFEKNKIEVVEEILPRKDSEADFIIKVPSAVGPLTYFCRTKSKKRINDGDISSAFIQGQSKRLPIIMVARGELTKKAQEILENACKGMGVTKI